MKLLSNVREKAGKIMAGGALSSIAMAAILSTSVVAPTAAHASAFGCDYNRGFGFTFQGVKVKAPKGFLCHSITGSKKHIKHQTARYGANPSGYGALTGKVCNWRIDFLYSDTRGKTYKIDKGPTRNYCSYTASRSVSADKHLPCYGKSCARLVMNGKTIETQCHNITSGFRLW